MKSFKVLVERSSLWLPLSGSPAVPTQELTDLLSKNLDPIQNAAWNAANGYDSRRSEREEKKLPKCGKGDYTEDKDDEDEEVADGVKERLLLSTWLRHPNLITHQKFPQV
ncbi:hypothetical protein M378DRAFT_161048 [Amanita muscaria Koide BX008]|uniref:Uncharacterized protein n=1 Tax=Amanita muscaria (strain Koide BX008) TaxID=946122 RepID=A0A0C2TH05_AMAMK|nr:hypothetical protein M378DRAFT_161048 [Amanita muscaria Koide BX008]